MVCTGRLWIFSSLCATGPTKASRTSPLRARRGRSVRSGTWTKVSSTGTSSRWPCGSPVSPDGGPPTSLNEDRTPRPVATRPLGQGLPRDTGPAPPLPIIADLHIVLRIHQPITAVGLLRRPPRTVATVALPFRGRPAATLSPVHPADSDLSQGLPVAKGPSLGLPVGTNNARLLAHHRGLLGDSARCHGLRLDAATADPALPLGAHTTKGKAYMT